MAIVKEMNARFQDELNSVNKTILELREKLILNERRASYIREYLVNAPTLPAIIHDIALTFLSGDKEEAQKQVYNHQFINDEMFLSECRNNNWLTEEQLKEFFNYE